jgi:hypothetical protein
MASWTIEHTYAYRRFAKQYISTYSEKIDCADLALASLIEFAYESGLPVKLKYYDKGWKPYDSAAEPSKAAFKELVMRNMGALNVIDNTHPIKLADAGAGDLIMSKWDTRLGHTRIIFDIVPESAAQTPDYRVVWFQGNLPAVVPQKREELFSRIESVYGGSPRRWNFDAFGR